MLLLFYGVCRVGPIPNYDYVLIIFYFPLHLYSSRKCYEIENFKPKGFNKGKSDLVSQLIFNCLTLIKTCKGLEALSKRIKLTLFDFNNCW